MKSLSLMLMVAFMSSNTVLAQEATPASTPVASATAITSSSYGSVRGVRYCEILVPELGGSRDRAALRVYTTQGLYECPLEAWDAIDARAEARRLGVPMVFKNGPRYVAYDQITAEIDGAVESFQGLDLRLVATLELPAGSSPLEQSAYSGMVVARNTEYLYLAGKPVFELIAPDGSVYVMQTYVAPGDPDGDFAVLGGLADQLALPEGWAFREIVPDEDLRAATTNGQATVIRDDLGNTYQLLTSGSGTPVPAS